MPARRTRLVTALSAGALLVTACGTDVPESRDAEFESAEDDPGADPDIDATDPDVPPTDEPEGDVFEGEDLSDAVLTTTSSRLGEHIVDGQGRTVYVFGEDPPNESTCTGQCVSVWPIVSTEDEPSVDPPLDEALVGVLERDDGHEQVTYNDKPLYYYIGDDEVGDIAGQGVADAWFIVTPDGDSIVEGEQADEDS